jgi:hypothetical protein
MQTKLLPDLEQHTLMLADSHNIFLKLKTNGTLANISSLFKKIYQDEINFASKELKRISNELDCNIDLDTELRNNSEIFRANLKEIVGKVIDIIWESGSKKKAMKVPQNGDQIKNNIIDNVFQDNEQKLENRSFKQNEQGILKNKKNKGQSKMNDVEGNNDHEFDKTFEFASDLYSYGNNTQGFGTQEIEELKKVNFMEKTQDLQNLKKKNLESNFIHKTVFFLI